jgi:hypothetical protein
MASAAVAPEPAAIGTSAAGMAELPAAQTPSTLVLPKASTAVQGPKGVSVLLDAELPQWRVERDGGRLGEDHIDRRDRAVREEEPGEGVAVGDDSGHAAIVERDAASLEHEPLGLWNGPREGGENRDISSSTSAACAPCAAP